MKMIQVEEAHLLPFLSSLLLLNQGGSDFDPKGKSPAEVRRFCTSFATELSRHIGADTDIPAGDIGFSTREGGFLFGQYKAIKNEWVGMMTGKAMDWGGSALRPEVSFSFSIFAFDLRLFLTCPFSNSCFQKATGYGTVYYTEHMIKHVEGESSQGFKGKKVVISGSGQVAQFAALKIMELGGTVLTLSDSKGSLVVKEGEAFTEQMIKDVYQIKYDKQELSTLGDQGGKLIFHEGKRPWELVKR